MEGLNPVKEVLREKKFVAKPDLQDAYFSISHHSNSRNYVSGKRSFSSTHYFVLGWGQHREFLQNF